MAGEVQGHQIVVEKKHDSFHSKERDSLNVKFDLLERFLDSPYRVDYASPVVEIGSNEVQLQESDGQQGELSGTFNIFKKALEPSISHEEIPASSLNLETGVATGAFESATPYCPVISASYYVWVGVEMIGNKWFVRWGIPGATESAATQVTFSNLAKRKLFTALCQKDGTTGTWGLSTSKEKFILFDGSGSSGSGGFDEGGDDYLITRYRMNFNDVLETDDNVDAAATTGEYTFVDQGKMVFEWSIRSFTKVGNSLTLASAPSFTLEAGDVVRQDDAWATVASVLDQTHITVDDATFLQDGKATFSQSLTTKDLMQQDGPDPLYNVDKTNIGHLSVKYTDNRNLFCKRNVAYVAATKSGAWSPVKINPPNAYQVPLSECVFDDGDAGAELYARFFSSATFDGVPVDAVGTTPTNPRIVHGLLCNMQ